MVDRDDGVQRRGEHRLQPHRERVRLLLGAPPLDHLADLAADHLERGEQVRVGLDRLVGEELHHANDAARAPEREAERRVQPLVARGIGAGEVRVRRDVGDPRGLAGRPDAPREADVARQHHIAARALECGRAVGTVPRQRTAKDVALHLPHCPDRPAELVPDRRERSSVHLDSRLRLREDERNGVLEAAPSVVVYAHQRPVRDMTDTDATDTRATEERGLRIVVADDDALLREGIASLLEDAGHSVVGRAADADDLLLKVRSHAPDVTVVDVRMPPTGTDDGLRAAQEIRARYPGTGVLVLSQHLEPAYLLELVADEPAGIGYLLKDRARDVAEFVDAVERVAAGGTAFDPEVVRELVGGGRKRDTLAELTERERDVLQLIAEGRSNKAIAKRLYLSPRAVERVVASIFQKLRLPESEDDNRRVLAVLALLGQ